MWSHRVRRREAARVAGQAAALLGGTTLLASLRPASALAAPDPSHKPLEVQMQLYVVGIPINATTTKLIQDFIDSSFNAKHKGVRAMFMSPYNESGVIASLLAGAPFPWVVSSCCTDWPVILPFLERLDPYLELDNIDVRATWGAGQLSRFRTPTGLYGLPEDAACDVYLYRQDILDDLGLPYPDPEWTAAEAAAFWRKCTGNVQGQWRYGTNCPFAPWTMEGLPTVVAGFGGQFMNADGTRCLLDQPGSIAAGEYWFNLVWDKVATWGDGVVNTAIASGQLVFETSADPTVLWAVLNLGQKAKWDFIPWPRFPVRPAGKLHDNFYGMMSAAPNKELAWEMLKWAAIEKDWSRFYMRIAMAPPARADMMDEWYAILRSAAPILRDKHLEYWGQPTLEGWGVYDFEFFKYAPSEAQSLLMTEWGNIWNHQVDVEEGFTQIARNINNLEATSAVTAGLLSTIASDLKSAHQGQYAAPSKAGVGAPAAPAGHAAVVYPGGATLLAGGASFGASEDACVFAAAPFTAVDGEVTCRIDAFSLANGSHLSQWALVGLMARNDLSSVSPMVAVGLTAGDGVAVVSRSIQTPDDVFTTPAIQMGQKGILTQAQTTVYPPAAGRGNVLRQPLWLRLVRKGTTWQAYASLDGMNWKPQGSSIQLEMAGCWVGFFATANAVPGNGAGAVRAACSRLSVRPVESVVIGRA